MEKLQGYAGRPGSKLPAPTPYKTFHILMISAHLVRLVKPGRLSVFSRCEMAAQLL